MADIYNKSKRSEIMSRIRSRGNQATEMAMVGLLKRHRITGWRRHRPMFGNPDFVFSKEKLAVFVDGCFWHGCPKHAKLPSANGTFWKEKLSRNKIRDRLVSRILRNRGWSVMRVWQHDLARSTELKTVARISRKLLLRRGH